MYGWVALVTCLIVLTVSIVIKMHQPANKTYDCVGKEDILVLIHSYKSNKETVFTMCQMIQAASCPYRLYFGIQQDVKHEQDIFDMYQQVKSDVDLSSHIRVLTRPKKHTHGPLASLVEIHKKLHGGEKYVLCTIPGTVFCDNFDDKLISYLPTGHVLTGAGERKMSKESKWMGYLNSALPQHLPRKTMDGTSSFPVLYQKPGAMPVVRSLETRVTTSAYEALAVDPRMMFFEHGVLNFNVVVYPPTAGICLTAHLFAENRLLFASPVTVAWGPKKQKKAVSPLYDEKDTVEWLRAQPELLDHLGFDYRLRPSGRSQMGLLPDMRFKLVKFQDEANFERYKMRFQQQE